MREFLIIGKKEMTQAVASVQRMLESFKMETDGHPLISILYLSPCSVIQFTCRLLTQFTRMEDNLQAYLPQAITLPSAALKFNWTVTADLPARV
jgi:hypothetical protein